MKLLSSFQLATLLADFSVASSNGTSIKFFVSVARWHEL